MNIEDAPPGLPCASEPALTDAVAPGGGPGVLLHEINAFLDALAACAPKGARPPVAPDEDGHCQRCGLPWPDERETTEPHECPPGFRRDAPTGAEGSKP